MIKEARVSFEVAKLLEDKSFDGECSSWYSTKGILYYDIDTYEADLDGITKLCLAPTHQVATAWLREVHKLHIGIFVTWKNKIPHYQWRIENLLTQDTIFDTPCLTSCEEAAEAALKYALENLVKI